MAQNNRIDMVGRGLQRLGIGALVLAVVTVLPPPETSAITAREVLDKANALDDTTRHWNDLTQKMTLHIFGKRGGKRERQLRRFTKRLPGDEEKSISFFLAPPEVKGTGFLVWAHKGRDDEQWLFLPELKRTRRITAQSRDSSFMGTDFSFRDLEIMGEFQDWTENDAPAKLIREELLNETPCYVIELHPKQEGMSYTRILLWMEQEQLIARKLDFYDRKEKHVKTLTLDDVRMIGSVPTPHRLEMHNLKKGSHTVVDLADVEYDTDLADNLFTQRHLERGGR